MEEALEMARSKDTKERMAGVERLHQFLEVSRKSLSSSEVSYLVDICLDLLKDNNFRVSQGALQALASAAVLSGDHLKLHFNALVPAIVERLGDGKQPVRDAARRLLLTLMEVSSPTIMVERAGSYAWTHKSWRVREEFARTVTSTLGLFSSTEPTLQRAILFPILQLLNDSNPGVKESAILCIEEMYSQYGLQFLDELQRHHIPASLIKDINSRMERIEPKTHPDALLGNFASSQMKPVNNIAKRSSPKSKCLTREVFALGGEIEATEKSIEPIKVLSEKELLKEVEKIAYTLVPEKDWSVRISALQRVESLVCGGATDYPCFIGILKQLVAPLSTQLSDRRSTIVKQTCHLLSFLSKELLGDFEMFAEMFIPVLFKLVVITVLVIAESADNCIKTMLRNCKVARTLPKIAECAKNDRSAVLRARCCEYALLILECWADAPEIQRSADLYEDLIKCCVGDAMSEVRSTARICFRMFTKTWPERSRRLYSSFDPVIQRIINDEEGGMHRRNPSPSLRERCGVQFPFSNHVSTTSSHSGYGISAIVAMDRTSSLPLGVSSSSGLILSQAKSITKGNERSLESVLHSSKQKVTAIESMLRGLEVSGKKNTSLFPPSSCLDLGVVPPSSRDPPFPLSITASNTFVNSFNGESINPAISKGQNDNSGLILSEIVSQIEASKEVSRYSQKSTSLGEVVPAIPPLLARRVPEKLLERSSAEETINIRDHRRLMNSSTDKQYFESYYSRDMNFRESQSGYIPNFQRPLLRRHASGRISAGRRKSFDDNQFPVGGISSYMCEPVSLNDALTDGLSSTSDWSARVSAFNCVQSLLQQGQKGIQDVSQSFERVMKMLFLHLDDPHHKVAQAALSTLSDIIPSCRKQFEGYMERILPHVFSRLVDPKEHVRQHCCTTLEILSKTYSTDSLLPTLLRSLDEQRSPKAKLAVIEFANNCFSANPSNSESLGNSGIMKLWLAKLAPLVHDKNPKLKEASVSCIISVYSHVDSSAVLNFIVCLSVDEQNSLRRALKQYTPKIEVDLMNFLQNKKERPRSKMAYDQSDVVGVSSEDGHTGVVKRTQYTGRCSSGSVDGGDGGRKWNSLHETNTVSGGGVHDDFGDGREPFSKTPETATKEGDWNYTGSADGIAGWKNIMENVQSSVNSENHVPDSGLYGLILPNSVGDIDGDGDNTLVLHKEIYTKEDHFMNSSMKMVSSTDTGLSIPQILNVISNGGDEDAVVEKLNALHQLVKISIDNDHLIWNKFFNQILTVVLEVLDDLDSSLRELALCLVNEMLINQKESMDESVEIVMEKLLHVLKDTVPKVMTEAERCLGIVLSQHDPFRCLSVVSPLLVTDDDKTLLICINSLTKLVSRFSQQQLMAQLPAFLPALFDAFGNRSTDVRKRVVFCLVDMYIILGKDFLPFLEGLNATQLRLVTLYASRISLARKGTTTTTTEE